MTATEAPTEKNTMFAGAGLICALGCGTSWSYFTGWSTMHAVSLDEQGNLCISELLEFEPDSYFRCDNCLTEVIDDGVTIINLDL